MDVRKLNLDRGTSPMPGRRARRRGGFSFTEILFAVIILGIGFIMVAGIFPVALQQVKATAEETTVVPIARASVPLLGVLSDGNDPLNTSNCPPLENGYGVAVVQPVGFMSRGGAAAAAFSPLWHQIRGNMIVPEDPRFGWVVMYRRGGAWDDPETWDPFVQIYVIGVEARATQRFDDYADTWIFPLPTPIPPPPRILPPAVFAANLMPRPIRIAVRNDSVRADGADLIAIDSRVTGNFGFYDGLLRIDPGPAAQGAYVIVRDDQIILPAGDQGRLNGQIFRLGLRRSDLDNDTGLFPGMANSYVYELSPGDDFTPDAGADGILGGTGIDDDIMSVGLNGGNLVQVSNFAAAYIVGRGYSAEVIDSIKAGTGIPNPPRYDGHSMAIGAYTTFVKVN